MTLKFLLNTILTICAIFSVYLYHNYRETGGFERETEQYYGYRHFPDNKITKFTSCEDVNKEFEAPAPKEWMIGCKKYLEMHSQ